MPAKVALVSPFAPRMHAPVIPSVVVDELLRCCQSQQWGRLAAKADDLTRQFPGNPLAWRARGKALLHLGRLDEAVGALEQALRLSAKDADALSDLGQAHLHLGQHEAAMQVIRKALKLQPRSTILHNNFGIAARALHRQTDARASFRLAVQHDPRHFEAWMNLGMTCVDLQAFEEAMQAYRQALLLQPSSSMALRCLGRLLTLLATHDEEAIACLTQAAALDPDNPDVHIDLGNALLRTGRPERYLPSFQRAQVLRPVVTWPAVGGAEADAFEMLLLDTPGSGSMPVRYLLGQAPFACHFYCVLPGIQPDLARLRAHGQVVLNIVADADNGGNVLPHAADLADALGLPVINHPRRILRTDRVSVAQRLRDIPHCHMPLTRRFTREDLLAEAQQGRLNAFQFPVLVRLSGNHGGDDFAKVGDPAELTAFLAAHGPGEYYLTEFVDYRSQDGCYRKYRFICIEGQVLPYHLAIHEDWMVHHFRTDMHEQPWKRDEEARFLAGPEAVFGAQGMQVLNEIAKAFGLDYQGIDCAVMPDGRVLVFEVNATMLVHDEQSPIYAYKNPHAARIKAAFEAMLRRRACGPERQAQGPRPPRSPAQGPSSRE